MLLAADFRERARNALSGNWGVAVGTGFVASLLGAYTALGNSSGSSSSSYDLSDEDIALLTEEIPQEVLLIIATILGIIAIVAVIYAIATFIIGGPITLGYVKFNLDMVNGYRPSFSDLFSQFHRFGEGFLLQFLRGLFIFLWTLLLIVPGIIATYSYAMAPYILYENPGMSASDAITESKKMMDGNKWRLFCLSFSFIGWQLLSIFTLGILNLWINPYMEAAYAAFYEELKREQFVMPAQSYDSNQYNTY